MPAKLGAAESDVKLLVFFVRLFVGQLPFPFGFEWMMPVAQKTTEVFANSLSLSERLYYLCPRITSVRVQLDTWPKNTVCACLLAALA